MKSALVLLLFLVTVSSAGEIFVRSDCTAEVFCDGKKLGDSPIRIVSVPSGYHLVQLKAINELREDFVYVGENSTQLWLSFFSDLARYPDRDTVYNLYDWNVGLIASYEKYPYGALEPNDPSGRQKYNLIGKGPQTTKKSHKKCKGKKKTNQ